MPVDPPDSGGGSPSFEGNMAALEQSFNEAMEKGMKLQEMTARKQADKKVADKSVQ